jgi:hypothetical protein
MKRPKRTSRGSSGDFSQHVGYRRPPIGTRWQPGKSGNPSGRKKGKKLMKTVAQSLEETLLRHVTIEEDGRPVSLSLQEVILRKLAYAAARGEMAAIKILFGLKDRYDDSKETTLNPEELAPDDRELIDSYLKKLKGSADQSAPQALEQSSDDVAFFTRSPLTTRTRQNDSDA